MDPSWILKSDFAKSELLEAENARQSVSDHYQVWKTFAESLPKTQAYGFKPWWHRYNHVAQHFKE